MDHRLLVAKEVIPQARVLLQSLSDACNVSVSENAQESLKESIFLAVGSCRIDTR